MWPFDKILEARIKELERTVEIVSGANSVLERELGRAQSQETFLMTRLLEIGGLAPRTLQNNYSGPKAPIQMQGKVAGWSQMRQNLEDNSRREYWEKKKRDQDIKEFGDVADRDRELAEFEKELLKKEKENVSNQS